MMGLAQVAAGGQTAGLRTFLDPLLQRIDLFRLKAVQLVRDPGEPQFLAIVDENLALEVQFLGQVQNPDLSVSLASFVCGFDKRNSSGGAPNSPRNHPRAVAGIAGSTDRAPIWLYSNPTGLPEKSTWAIAECATFGPRNRQADGLPPVLFRIPHSTFRIWLFRDRRFRVGGRDGRYVSHLNRVRLHRSVLQVRRPSADSPSGAGSVPASAAACACSFCFGRELALPLQFGLAPRLLPPAAALPRRSVPSRPQYSSAYITTSSDCASGSPENSASPAASMQVMSL